MRTRDRVLATGEKLSVQLFALGLRNRGVDAVPLNADTFLETDDQFGEANPLGGLAERTIRSALSPLLAEGKVPVVTGYCGRAPDGATTTLGRGGSDLSAAVLAAALDAKQVTLWSDVDGVYSADPRVVPEARVIPQLNYREAAEMSFYGAKVLHQRTMIPVLPRDRRGRALHARVAPRQGGDGGARSGADLGRGEGDGGRARGGGALVRGLGAGGDQRHDDQPVQLRGFDLLGGPAGRRRAG
jgi:aspartokinase